MKSCFYVVVFSLFFGAVSFSQNFSKVEKFAQDSNWNEAYKQLLVLKEKDIKGKLESNAEYEYWLGYVISKAGISNKAIDGLPNVDGYQDQGLTHLKKAYALDKSLKNFYTVITNPYKAFWDIYVQNYQSGVNAYNDEKNYPKAAKLYDRANMVGEFIAKEGIGLSVLDTNLVFLQALNFVQMQNAELAAPYVERLVKAKAKPTESLELLKWVVGKSLDEKNEKRFNQFRSLGEEYFPALKAEVWEPVAMEFKLSASTSGEAKIATYEKMIFDEKSTDSRLKYNYVVELYSFLSEGGNLEKIEEKKAQAYLDKMGSIADEVFTQNKESYQPLYLYQATLFRYCDALNSAKTELNNQLRTKAAPVKGIAPKGSKLEKELNELKAKIKNKEAILKAWAKKGITPSEKIIGALEEKAQRAPLEKSDKNQFSNVLDIAAGISYYAGDNEKSDLYDQKRKSLKK